MSKFHQIVNYIKHYFTSTKKGHNVHSPFVYKLCEEVFYNEHSFHQFENLNELREKLLKDKTVIDVLDLGVGSQQLRSNKRFVRDIAKHGISSRMQAEILFRLINYLNITTTIELGTSIGLSSIYLSLANTHGKVYTIDGSEQLVNFAKKISQQLKINNCEYITGNFDSELPKLLTNINTFDLAYIDGNHSYTATLNYFNTLLNHKHQNSILIFDDIYWSKEMTRAWEEIKSNAHITLSIDCFYFGIVFFKPELKETINIKIHL